MAENLWPDFDIGQSVRSPKTVIIEAGNGLKKKTNGLVVFSWFGPASITGNNVELAFSLYAPLLSYHFPFLRAKFALEPVYPVTVVAHKMVDMVASDENELTAALAKVFNAPSTVETIQRLMSLAQQ